MISADQALRHLMGVWVLAGLATIFFCIVVTPVLIVIGFAGKFQSMWELVASRPFLTSFALVVFMALVHLDYDYDRIGVNATEIEAAGVRRIRELEEKRYGKVDRGESFDLTAMSDVRKGFW